MTLEIAVPGDKSIAHRALLLGMLADGRSVVDGLPDGRDVASTASCVAACGAAVARDGARATIDGLGIGGPAGDLGELDCGNSGTTMRLLCGVLAGREVSATLVGDASLTRMIIRNNVLHDSYNNDILKVNNAATDVVVERNLFYNQTGSDEHIDANSVENVVIQDNVFFSDFAGSGRTNDSSTSSFIVVKDSNANGDIFLGSRGIVIRRNVFLHYEGNTAQHFLRLGEDGTSNFEVDGALVENNLMLGNSESVLRAAFGVKGCRDVIFRHNTVVGDLPALAFAMRLNVEGQNLSNEAIAFHNNVWSDPTGTMGESFGGSNDFSDTPPGETLSFVLDNNGYWNGGAALPEDPGELVNPSDDAAAVLGDPLLGSQAALVVPHYDSDTGTFADGSDSIREAFVRLATLYGTPAGGSVVLDAADSAQSPADDLLGQPRTDSPDLGAIELSPLFGDGFESGDVSAWSSSSG